MPIIHSIFELYKNWQKILPHFPTTSRHTLGFRIDTLIIQFSEAIFASGFLPGLNKLPVLERTSKKLDSIKFLLRLSWESEIIKDKQFILLSENLEKIGKQIGGWLKQLKQNSPQGEKLR